MKVLEEKTFFILENMELYLLHEMIPTLNFEDGVNIGFQLPAEVDEVNDEIIRRFPKTAKVDKTKIAGLISQIKKEIDVYYSQFNYSIGDCYLIEVGDEQIDSFNYNVCKNKFFIQVYGSKESASIANGRAYSFENGDLYKAANGFNITFENTSDTKCYTFVINLIISDGFSN